MTLGLLPPPYKYLGHTTIRTCTCVQFCKVRSRHMSTSLSYALVWLDGRNPSMEKLHKLVVGKGGNQISFHKPTAWHDHLKFVDIKLIWFSERLNVPSTFTDTDTRPRRPRRRRSIRQILQRCVHIASLLKTVGEVFISFLPSFFTTTHNNWVRMQMQKSSQGLLWH